MTKIRKIENVVLKNDFDEAQSILDESHYTSNVWVEGTYNSRVDDSFNFTYAVKIDNDKEYNRFLFLLEKEKGKRKTELRNEVMERYNNDEITKDEASERLEEIQSMEKTRLEKFERPSYQAWKTNRLENGQRLAKAMRKAGFSDKLLDFYSLQSKEEKDLYLTVTDKAQYIAGMSYYGKGWSSCQDTSSPSSYNVSLAGSLHDDKLYIAFLHENLEDLDDMESNMIARVIMRLIEFEGENILVATRYYGTNDGVSHMHNALELLESVENVYSTNARGYDSVTEEANGHTIVYSEEEVRIERDDYEYIDIECPMCEGYGTYEVYDSGDNEHSVECPHCNGHGEVETEHYINIDEYVTVENEIEVLPYDEGYIHSGSYIEMDIDKDYIEEKRNEREGTESEELETV